jgi:ABC-2 type transport system ATP-binding protein
MKVSINNVDVSLGKKKILKELNCEFTNHIYGLMGANGSGKTTFIRTVLGIYKETKGEIKFYKENDVSMDIHSLNIGYLPQTFDVFKDLTAYDQLRYFAILKDIPKIKREEEIESVLKLTHLIEHKDKKCKQLSGGMVRRLGIAQALLGNPDILIFDEPTAGLDPQERLKFREVVHQLKINIPIIISTHIVDDLKNLCSHILFLKDGQINYNGTIDDLLSLLMNKVYSCSSENIDQIEESINIVYTQDNKVRIVSDNPLNYQFLEKVEANLDDAYVYLNR